MKRYCSCCGRDLAHSFEVKKDLLRYCLSDRILFIRSIKRKLCQPGHSLRVSRLELCLELQMTFRTVVQADHIFVDQLACLSAKQTSGGDTPEKIQDSTGNSTNGCSHYSECTSCTSTTHHADDYRCTSCGNPGCGSNRTGAMKWIRNRGTVRTKDLRHSNDSFFQLIKPATEAAGVRGTLSFAPLPTEGVPG